MRAQRPSTFRQVDVTRALRAAVAAGLPVAGYTIDKDGKIVVQIGTARDPAAGAPNPKEWDDIA
jgi:hypothetical protein